MKYRNNHKPKLRLNAIAATLILITVFTWLGVKALITHNHLQSCFICYAGDTQYLSPQTQFQMKAYAQVATSSASGSQSAVLGHPNELQPTPTPTERDLIIVYIKKVFGDQSKNAFKILACENHSLNPNAQGKNKDGSIDTGIFQINSLWANPAILKNWKTNVDLAYQIYLRGGWNEWACESQYHALERNDTI